MTSPVSGGFQFTPPDGMNNAVSYPTTPVSEVAARQMWMDLYWQLMNEMNKPTLSAAAFAQYNKLINGGFPVNQRQVSGTATLAAGQYGHDRWKAGAGGCTYTFSTVNNVTTITITAGSLVQVIEGINLFSGTYTLSWTGTAQGKIGAGAYSASGVTGTAVGGTNLSIEFNVGTLSKVQFNAGDQALPFQPRSFDDEYQSCQRYYQRYDNETSSMIALGLAGSTTVTNILLTFPRKMRVIPTLAYSAVGDLVLGDGNSSVVATSISIQSVTASTKEVLLLVGAAGLVQYRPYMLEFGSTGTSKFVAFDAEL